jgi:hypothetical protein
MIIVRHVFIFQLLSTYPPSMRNELLSKLVLPPEGDGDLITGEGSGGPNGGFLEGLPGVYTEMSSILADQ